MLWLQTSKVSSGTMDLGGSLTRQIEKDAAVTAGEASPHNVEHTTTTLEVRQVFLPDDD